MIIKKVYITLLVLFVLTISQNKITACSMYKITADGKTMIGCNHDSWLTTPKIWFENSKHKNRYGAVFTGSRKVSPFRTTPQSGMNTKGLTFSRLSAFYPTQNNPFKDRQKITNEAEFLSNILFNCATIREVKQYIEVYDHSFFLNDVFIYIDSFGDYLIVEPYNLIYGNSPNYVLANFCPSITDNKQARKLERYRNGEDFIKTNKAIASLDFCTALSDSMSVCRRKNGDGTLITSIFDTKEKTIGIYFYHNFDTLIQYSLTDELSKGDHTLNLPEIFPKNSEFERLINFKTPANSIALRILLLIMAGLLVLFIIALLVLNNKTTFLLSKSILIFSPLNTILVAYIAVLITNNSIFYFDVPYKHYSSNLISAVSYTPFLLLLIFIPITIYTRNRLKSDETKLWIKATIVLNNIVYFFLLLCFGYWGLFNFWN